MQTGGITQIKAIKRAIEKYKLNISLNIPVFGMIKDEKHNTKALINDERKEIKLNDTLINFVTNLQDEVHNIAIEYNRKLRNKETTKSNLDIITGIGQKKKQDLLKTFGSVEQIKKATIEEISSLKGITAKLAKKIKQELN